MFDDEAAVDLGRDPDDLEVLIEGDFDDRANNDETGENQDNVDGNQPDPESTPVPPKKRAVKRPQPKLDPERLKGPRGVATLEHVFKDFKFQGKGHEKDDLNRMMKQLEHWAHRLFPRFQFDDCLEKIEKLGHRKPVGTLVKRIRMGLETGDEPIMGADDEEGGDTVDKHPDIGDATDSPLDAFDALLSQQLSEARARTPMPPIQPSRPPQALSEDQRERMLKNRQLAEERRLARLKMQMEENVQKESEFAVSHEQPSEVNSVVEEASQHVASAAATSSGSSCQEILSQHLLQPDLDVSVAQNLKQSSSIENTDGVYTVNKLAVDDSNADANNKCSELTLHNVNDVIDSCNTASPNCIDKIPANMTSLEDPDASTFNGQGLEKNVGNVDLYGEDIGPVYHSQKDVDQSSHKTDEINNVPLCPEAAQDLVEMDISNLD